MNTASPELDLYCYEDTPELSQSSTDCSETVLGKRGMGCPVSVPHSKRAKTMNNSPLTPPYPDIKRVDTGCSARPRLVPLETPPNKLGYLTRPRPVPLDTPPDKLRGTPHQGHKLFDAPSTPWLRRRRRKPRVVPDPPTAKGLRKATLSTPVLTEETSLCLVPGLYYKQPVRICEGSIFCPRDIVWASLHAQAPRHKPQDMACVVIDEISHPRHACQEPVHFLKLKGLHQCWTSKNQVSHTCESQETCDHEYILHFAGSIQRTDALFSAPRVSKLHLHTPYDWWKPLDANPLHHGDTIRVGNFLSRLFQPLVSQRGFYYSRPLDLCTPMKVFLNTLQFSMHLLHDPSISLTCYTASLVICTFFIISRAVEYNNDRCVAYICSRSRRPFITELMSSPITELQSLLASLGVTLFTIRALGPYVMKLTGSVLMMVSNPVDLMLEPEFANLLVVLLDRAPVHTDEAHTIAESLRLVMDQPLIRGPSRIKRDTRQSQRAYAATVLSQYESALLNIEVHLLRPALYLEATPESGDEFYGHCRRLCQGTLEQRVHYLRQNCIHHLKKRYQLTDELCGEWQTFCRDLAQAQ